jgi:transaldolase
MWKAGLTDYRSFAQRLLERITKHPISFEVFADSAEECGGRRGKSPPGVRTSTSRFRDVTTDETMAPVVRELSESGVKVNDGCFPTAQVELVTAAVKDGAPSYVSVFAGRIADAGIDPQPIMARAVDILLDAPGSELIWASPREILNVVQADQIGCQSSPLRTISWRSSKRSGRTWTSSRSRQFRCSDATPLLPAFRSDSKPRDFG